MDFDYYVVNRYEDIECYGPREISFSFTWENDVQAEAVLILCTPDTAREYIIFVTTSNGTAATLYFMDPTVDSLYGGVCVYGSASYALEANVPYYMVVCLDLANGDEPAIEIDEIIVTVTFI